MSIKLTIIMGGGGHTTEMLHILHTSSLPPPNAIITHPSSLPKLSFPNIYYITRPTLPNTRLNLISIFSYLFSTFKVFIKLRRCDYVLCNGPGICILFCFLQKIIGAKIIYIESLARYESLSVTGKCMEWIADLFVVQSKKLVMGRRKYYNFFFEEN